MHLPFFSELVLAGTTRTPSGKPKFGLLKKSCLELFVTHVIDFAAGTTRTPGGKPKSFARMLADTLHRCSFSSIS